MEPECYFFETVSIYLSIIDLVENGIGWRYLARKPAKLQKPAKTPCPTGFDRFPAKSALRGLFRESWKIDSQTFVDIDVFVVLKKKKLMYTRRD